MEIKIERATLLQGLYLAQGISERRTTMPILANVLLRTDGKDRLLLAATDTNVTVVSELKCKTQAEGGITISAKHLHDIVKSLPGDDLVLRRTDNNYAEIRAGKVEYKVVGMADRDFPKLPSHREVSFNKVAAATVRDMIAKTFFSISADETRYHLSGVLFESDGKLARMVSTDGHRLCKVERPLDGPKLQKSIIIPRKGLTEARKLLENVDQVEIGLHGNHLFLRVREVAISIKLVDAQFPPYDQVIPKENEKVAQVGRLALLEALRRVSLMSSDKNFGVRFSLQKGALEIRSDNPDLGQAHEEVVVSYEGAALQIGFNAKYFIELLSEMGGDEVCLELNGELDPALVRPVDNRDYVGVVMPMRI